MQRDRSEIGEREEDKNWRDIGEREREREREKWRKTGVR